MNTKTLRSLFALFTQIVETNTPDFINHYLYYLNMDFDLPCPEGCEALCTMPAELRDGSLGLAIEYTFLDNEGDAYTRMTVLKPDYTTGRMVRELPIRPRHNAR